MKPRDRILVALDTDDRERALGWVRLLAGRVGGFKIGLELFAACGPTIVREVVDSGNLVFLDLKLHDIPKTVAGASAAVTRLGVSYLTVHALGGKRMVRAAVEAAAEAAEAVGVSTPTILGITILTSHDEAELQEIGLAGPCSDAAVRLARLMREAGAAGAVCSPLEVASVRDAFPSGTLVVPGIRPVSLEVRSDDQQRTASPARAVRLGADRLVVGRPVTLAPDPAAAVEALAREIELGENV